MEDNTKTKPEFNGMPMDALAVLRDLKGQERFDWMQEHRLRVHASLRDPFVAYLEAATVRLAEESIDLAGGHSTLYRLHRDSRFNRSGRPFHGHIEALLAQDGERTSAGPSIRVRFDSSGGFLRAGLFLQPPTALRALRESMVARKERFLDIAKTMEQRGCGLVARKLLKRAPRGFTDVEDAALLEYLRLVDPMAERRISLREWSNTHVVEATLEFARACRPWLLFVREALGAPPEGRN